MDEAQMKQRTKEFAKQIIKHCRELPNNREGRLIGDQIFRAGTRPVAVGLGPSLFQNWLSSRKRQTKHCFGLRSSKK
jgi:hypothetical protein